MQLSAWTHAILISQLGLLMRSGNIHLLIVGLVLFLSAMPLVAQSTIEEILGGPDSHETESTPRSHLLGDWGGKRTRLESKGFRFDLHYISDFLWNIKSVQKERLATFDRIRGTVDIDFGKPAHQDGLYFHATGLWQGRSILGNFLVLLTSPSGMSSGNTARHDS